ncbi:uncharacterized protein LOC128554275 [Mercenaria mercenaria]|uniref:uncharacterized protein LOC128554275 n=1 Tax=Mercenaria mercenaria TaxID=6596 RepID=UPI00234F434D|nr:uncharacterized protein LOC128554275 [Mercenaria mercenaria]
MNSYAVFLCGDFNSRCGDEPDFIEGIDEIPMRNVVDFTSNEYSDIFIDFLISSNFCILNGRNHIGNDFTCIRPQGASVVDYCLVSHTDLHLFTDFNVLRVSDLLQQANVQQPTSVPDHSILIWNISHNFSNELEVQSSVKPVEQVKFFTDKIPGDFMHDDNVVSDLIQSVNELEQSFRSQQCIDKAYKKLCIGIKTDMIQKIRHKTVVYDSSVSNKKRRVGKQWWSDELTELWNKVCASEKKWLGCNIPNTKKRLKVEYTVCRKIFSRAVQKAKRSYWFRLQEDMLCNVENDQGKFWKSIGKVGVAYDKEKNIPLEIVNEDGSYDRNPDHVLQHWKKCFESLHAVLPPTNNSVENFDINSINYGSDDTDRSDLNSNISILEVDRAVSKAGKNKACGIDGIPYEMYKNRVAITVLHRLFNVCFETGKIPTDWGKGMINPIPKSGSTDPRDPMAYRGITLAPAMYKLYCSVLNDRLCKWLENNDLLCDEQNGFRKERGTIDQVSTLTSIIESRLKSKSATFVAYIDFKKAYDTIDRSLLWRRLVHMGVSNRMLKAVVSIYDNVKSCIKLNGYVSEWFDVKIGLRQGCILSPVLFNCFINDLAVQINASGRGIDIGEN